MTSPLELGERRALGERRQADTFAPSIHHPRKQGVVAGVGVPALAAASVWCALAGCDPSPMAEDAAADRDGAVLDARPDTRSDAGCTRVSGELVGERDVELGRLPLLSFAGSAGEVALADHHAPCAPAGRVIVLREVTAWSAHSLWHIAHSAALVAMDDVTVIDLWSADFDGLPARFEQLPAFAARYDELPDAVAIDPDERLGVLGIAGIALPIVLVVDARTLDVERTLLDPRADEVELAVRSAQAELREEPWVPRPERVLVDGRFTRDRWDLIVEMARPFVPPPSPSNAVADDPRAAALGETLFEDAALSPADVSCATCHDPVRSFTDGRPLGRGVLDVTRHTPTVLGASGARWQFWDGRADTLWAQALGPIENAREMGSTRLFVAHRIATAHRAEYEASFGALPPLEDAARFPPRGLPGDPAWESMAPADREAVTRVFVNVGKAIEAFERTIVPVPGRLEAYAGGDLEALTVAQRDGLHAYFITGCAQCHAGPLLTNGAFFAVDVPGVGEGATGDQGRIDAYSQLRASPFRAHGAYSDDPSVPDPLAGLDAFPERTRGAFRTPTLRSIRETAPYGHAGTFGTLREIVEHYAHIRRPHDPDPRVVGELDPHLQGFEDHPHDHALIRAEATAATVRAPAAWRDALPPRSLLPPRRACRSRSHPRPTRRGP
jgi:cytochrome c peroxidase